MPTTDPDGVRSPGAPAVLAAVLTAAVVAPGCAARSGSGDGAARALECATFESARIQAGESFSAPIGRGLAVRLTPTEGGAWRITVAPDGDRDTDYLWVVSPPLQTAPHLLIGNGYGVPAWQSVRTTPRRFQFVTTEEEYDDALDLVQRRGSYEGVDRTVADIERRGKGSLLLWITDFGLRDGEDRLDWIGVRGRACQPRLPAGD